MTSFKVFLLDFSLIFGIINNMKPKNKTIINQQHRHISPMSEKQQNIQRSLIIDPLNFNKVWSFYEKKIKDKWVAYDATKDYFYFKQLFEDQRNLKRRMMLKPSIIKEISQYIYNLKDAPSYIDMWTAPIKVLKEKGLLKRLFRTKALMA